MRFVSVAAGAVVVGLLGGTASAEMAPVPLEQRAEKASRIAVGRVTAQHTYWARARGAVMTASRVRVDAWIKGAGRDSEVVVLSLGGVLGDRATVAIPSLELVQGEDYVLFLDPQQRDQDDRNLRQREPGLWQSFAYADVQGALLLQGGRYRDVFGPPMTQREAAGRLSRLVGSQPTTPAGRRWEAPDEPVEGERATRAVAGMSPTVTHGGTIDPADFVTITGSGFGGAAGTVFFTNADDGGATFTASGIASDNTAWADGSITVKPARRAGTGPINVNGAMTSGSNLTIDWTHIEINSSFSGFGSSTRQRYYLRNLDGLGGMTFRYNTTSGFSANWDPLESTCRHASLSIL